MRTSSFNNGFPLPVLVDARAFPLADLTGCSSSASKEVSSSRREPSWDSPSRIPESLGLTLLSFASNRCTSRVSPASSMERGGGSLGRGVVLGRERC